jgi:hypothetical protein
VEELPEKVLDAQGVEFGTLGFEPFGLLLLFFGDPLLGLEALLLLIGEDGVLLGSVLEFAEGLVFFPKSVVDLDEIINTRTIT